MLVKEKISCQSCGAEFWILHSEPQEISYCSFCGSEMIEIDLELEDAQIELFEDDGYDDNS